MIKSLYCIKTLPAKISRGAAAVETRFTGILFSRKSPIPNAH